MLRGRFFNQKVLQMIIWNYIFQWSAIFLIVELCINTTYGQELKFIDLQDNSLKVKSFNQALIPKKTLPLVSFLLDDEPFHTATLQAENRKATVNDQVEIIWQPDEGFDRGIKGDVKFTNISKDTIFIRNVVPFGADTSHVFITGKGSNSLSRTHLFRPGYAPVNVIVPDNAWELGYSGIPLSGNQSVCALVRRTSVDEKTSKRRFETIVAPGGSVIYTLYADLYEGEWQEGLRKVFQERYLYDVENFDNSLYEREDLRWMRHSYVIHLMMAWDQKFYDSKAKEYRLNEFLDKGEKLYGGDDVFSIWPTWPALGLDQRNQWDLFRDLPGGLDQLRSLANMSKKKGTKFFICYNPWDESTRNEGHLQGMAELIGRTGADGVVLDTKGSSSKELQAAADGVHEGVIMYSEGMAVPKDMQGIISGRVHNALYYPPLLNLNKFIKPDFAIFRVAELAYDRIRREYATSFFNGYGTEINIFRPGHPEWVEEDYRFFGRTVRILRENTSNFIQEAYTPLLSTLQDKIYVNIWPKGEKIIYTVFSLIPEGYNDALFEIEPEENFHFIDLWNHQEVDIDTIESKFYAKANISGFDKDWLGTNNEGAVGAIAKLPEVLNVSLNSDQLTFSANRGDKIRIWEGQPDYEEKPKEYSTEGHTIRLLDVFGGFEGKFIVQLLQEEELLDEKIIKIEPGTPRMVSKVKSTETSRRAPKGMVAIPSGEFTMKVTQGDQFIPYPPSPVSGQVSVPKFFMDKHPVTNAEYKKFIETTGYLPEDTTNYLKKWKNGRIPAGKEDYPVVHVAYEDANAYAQWAGKRLPSELEWQYAAQASKGLEWPWGKDNKNVSKEDQYVTNTLTVSNFEGIDSILCNTGNGIMDPVGSYPKGANPYGLEDLVGSVWQMTNDVYDNTSYKFVILKGGSYFKPAASWWYVQGGPRKLHYRQMLLRVSPGFERNATVGFRCVKDAK